MEWLTSNEVFKELFNIGFLKQIFLVLILVKVLISHIKNIEKSVENISNELRDLKLFFREHSRRLGNAEGSIEALLYRVYDLEKTVMKKPE